MLPASLGTCYQLDFPFFSKASVTKKARSKYWFACFRDLQGKHRRVSPGLAPTARDSDDVPSRPIPKRIGKPLALGFFRVYEPAPPVTTRPAMNAFMSWQVEGPL
jgi:hypothetical protein